MAAESSTSTSHGERLSLGCNRPTRWKAACSEEERFKASLFAAGQPPLTHTVAFRATGTPPFFPTLLGAAAFSWPLGVALKNRSFMTLFMGTIPQPKGALGKEILTVHQKCLEPSLVSAKSYSSKLNCDCVEKGEYDEDHLFASHKHIHEEVSGKGGTDPEEQEEEETVDFSKDVNQAQCSEPFLCSRHILEEGSDEGEPDAEEDEDDQCGYFDPIQPAGLHLEESGSMPLHLTLGDDGDDDDEFIVFSEGPEVVDTNPVGPTASRAVTALVHTFSYSSDESGFCENITDSSDEESEDDDEDEIGVVLDEDLWHELEQQVHFFVGIKPPCSSAMFSKKPSVSHCQLASPEHSTDSATVATDPVHRMPGNTCVLVPVDNCETYSDKDTTNDSTPRLCCSSPSLHKTRKSVSFKPDSELVQVHTMVTWRFAYHACRRGPWEQIARDRDRFRVRIENTARILNPCLKSTLAKCSSS